MFISICTLQLHWITRLYMLPLMICCCLLVFCINCTFMRYCSITTLVFCHYYLYFSSYNDFSSLPVNYSIPACIHSYILSPTEKKSKYFFLCIFCLINAWSSLLLLVPFFFHHISTIYMLLFPTTINTFMDIELITKYLINYYLCNNFFIIYQSGI